MSSFLASQIKDISTELILEALENGDPIQVAETLRNEVRAGWLAALEASGMPEESIRDLKFPL